ncbi:MAG: YdcF family protein [Bacteroidales bacterium]|nr:YdcF family protein [Bacteroidota bacterium]MBL6949305.1 YdcF family protein [Bacteroidales bacterium]
MTNREQGKKYWLISKRVRWGLTIWGWLSILLIITLSIFLLMTQLYSFLAPVHREKSDMLILEGAAPDYVLEAAIIEFEENNYKYLVTTGTPLEWGHLLVEYGNTANIAASSLKKMGFDSTNLVAIATEEIQNNRTYNSALEFASYLRQYHPEIKAINLMSYGPHSRRSQMMFQAALGKEVKVGIISIQSFYYGPNDWWKSSKGFREVINELLGYIFVKFFFVPYEIKQDSRLKTQE